MDLWVQIVNVFPIVTERVRFVLGVSSVRQRCVYAPGNQ
jgi:hypothetical protein